jgi:hypothetical protein
MFVRTPRSPNDEFNLVNLKIYFNTSAKYGHRAIASQNKQSERSTALELPTTFGKN